MSQPTTTPSCGCHTLMTPCASACATTHQPIFESHYHTLQPCPRHAEAHVAALEARVAQLTNIAHVARAALGTLDRELAGGDTATLAALRDALHGLDAAGTA